MTEQFYVWAVNANGEAHRVGYGTRLNPADTRQVVMATSPQDAVNAVNEQAFKVSFKDATNDEPAEIDVTGEIGDPYTACDAKSMNRFLQTNRGRDVKVQINSGGGLAFDGLSMNNALRNHDGKVTTIVNAFAGSAATVIATAGSLCQIYENSQFFVHRASLLAYGNRDAMAEAIDWLDAIDEAIAKTYKAKTNKALDKILNLMTGTGKKDGTRFSAKEAVSEKFMDEVIPLKRTTKNEVETAVNSSSMMFVDAARAKRIRENSALFVPAE